jgi:DNA-binding response OmpR family regulator
MPRILCTDDDPDSRELLAFILNDAGFDTICAENAQQALELARNERFDLYILDGWLPDFDGADLCRSIRGFDPDTPILFYSGAAFPADKERAFFAGAQRYLIKPATPANLIAEVRRLIDGRTTSRSLRSGRSVQSVIDSSGT